MRARRIPLGTVVAARVRVALIAPLGVFVLCGACSPGEAGDAAGASASGGMGANGAGGSSAAGATSAADGAAGDDGTGAAAAADGNGTGGSPPTGGTSGAGGIVGGTSAGGSPPAGGSSATGGTSGAGGIVGGTGAGGSPPAGGSSATGGATGAAGAGGSSGAAGSSAGGSASGGKPSAHDEKAVGHFNVTLVAPTAERDGYTSLLGVVYDDVPNQDIVWELADEQGGCRLLTPHVPFCDPMCTAGYVCVDGDVCRKTPAPRSVGTVSVYGLQTAAGSSELTMHPLASSNSYQLATSVDLLYPPCAEGAEVRIETSGGDYAPFEIQSTGISPLELLGGEVVALEPGQPVTLQWTAPGPAAASRIAVEIDISRHGGTKGQVTCDVDDTGSLEIPASLITELIELGYSGFPTVIVRRKAVGSATIEPGRVDLAVLSSVERLISIPGLVSCTDDSDCESGQRCGPDLTCS
jgi:hypothetical protein